MARVLLTGASSFSGLWIAEALSQAGHEVVCPLPRRLEEYAGIRLMRVQRLQTMARVAFEQPFGSSALLHLASAGPWDVLAHHGADIAGYRQADYDPVAGFHRNTDWAAAMLRSVTKAGAVATMVTGTTFEAGEGTAPAEDLAISPYGLSKTLTNQAWRHLARWEGLRFGKFVVAAPFGPFEEGRFGLSLFQSWMADQPAVVRTPAYVRDNLAAPLLGLAYARFVGRLLDTDRADLVARPSGIVGTQGAFARRMAKEASQRLGRPCWVEDLAQPRMLEPEVRVNTDPVHDATWDEAAFWDAYVDYYRDLASRGLLASASA